MLCGGVELNGCSVLCGSDFAGALTTKHRKLVGDRVTKTANKRVEGRFKEGTISEISPILLASQPPPPLTNLTNLDNSSISNPMARTKVRIQRI